MAHVPSSHPSPLLRSTAYEDYCGITTMGRGLGPEPALAARRRVAAPAGPAGAPRGSGRGAVVGGACGARSLRCKRSCTPRRARARRCGPELVRSERDGWDWWRGRPPGRRGYGRRRSPPSSAVWQGSAGHTDARQRVHGAWQRRGWAPWGWRGGAGWPRAVAGRPPPPGKATKWLVRRCCRIKQPTSGAFRAASRKQKNCA